MTFRLIAAAIVSLLLAGCWMGKPFYTVSDAATPIAPGDYRVSAVPDKAKDDDELLGSIMRVSIGAGKETLVRRIGPDEPDEDISFLLVPLDQTHGLYIGQAISPEPEREQGTVPYVLFAVSGTGFTWASPFCKETRQIALDAGAHFQDDPKIPVCLFFNRGQLEAAMRIYARSPGNTIALERLTRE